MLQLLSPETTPAMVSSLSVVLRESVTFYKLVVVSLAKIIKSFVTQ